MTRAAEALAERLAELGDVKLERDMFELVKAQGKDKWPDLDWERCTSLAKLVRFLKEGEMTWPEKWKAQMRPRLKVELRPELKVELRPELKAELKTELRPELKTELRPELKAEVRAEIQAEIEAELRPKVEALLLKEGRAKRRSR